MFKKPSFETISTLERWRLSVFDRLIDKVENIKTELLFLTRDGLSDIDDKTWKEIENKTEKLCEFLDELDKNKYKIHIKR